MTCVECDAPTGHEPDCAIWLDQQKDAELVALRAKVGELERVIAGTASPFFAESLREEIRSRLIGEMSARIAKLEADAERLNKIEERRMFLRTVGLRGMDLRWDYRYPDGYWQEGAESLRTTIDAAIKERV